MENKVMAKQKIASKAVNKPVESKEEILAAELGLESETLEIEAEAQETVSEEVIEAAVESKPEKPEIAKNDAGVPLFRRLKPKSVDVAVVKKERSRPTYKAPTKQIGREVSANAALINFPTDRYGITKDLKTAFIRTASRIAGDDNKKELVDKVLELLTLHMNIKFKADQSYRGALAKRDAKANESK